MCGQIASTMLTRRGQSSDLPALKALLYNARYVYRSIGDEDLPGLVENGLTVLAGEASAPWGALAFSLEPRPSAPSQQTVGRGQLRALALLQGHWPSEATPTLMAAAEALFSAEQRPLLLVAYADSSWIQKALRQAGFVRVDQIIFFRFDRLHRQPIPPSPQIAGVALRPATPADLPALVDLDEAAFERIWHFGEQEISELLWRGQLQVASRENEIVGYAAVMHNSPIEAHLARLAVHPHAQGQGIGRTLLYDGMRYAREAGYKSMSLNTQASNLRSQALYRATGFHKTDDETIVLTRELT